MSITTVRLGEEIETELSALAEARKRSKSWLINQALKEYLERQNSEMLRWEETLVAIESVAAGRVLEGEDVHAWLRSWGAKNERIGPRKRK